MKTISLCILFLLVCAVFAEIFADEQLEKEVLTIAHELRCPICQGLSVKESMNDISINMKNKIRSLLLEGKSHKEILVFFEERYGEWVFRTPNKTGWNISLWFAPFAAIFIAIFFVFFSLKKKYKNKDL